jgi:hypothetical protein
VGKKGVYRPEIPGWWPIDHMQEHAYDNVGEAAEDWLDGVPKEQENELGEALTKVFNDWLDKHDLRPTFYPVTNVTSHIWKGIST